MKKRMWTRLTSLVLALVLTIAVVPAASAKAANMTVEIDNKSAFLIEKNVDSSAIENLLNSQTLHPQKTGYPALDSLLESIVAPYADKSVAEKVKACYNWTVRNIAYSWAGYNRGASAGLSAGYKNFNYKAHPAPAYGYELQKAMPEEVIARTYYTMTAHKGVCYDWGAVLAVMLRYVGLNAYVHTGMFRFEEELGFSGRSYGHHGWTEVTLNGKNYIFDPQREYRACGDGKGTISYTRYFGIANGHRHYNRYNPDKTANAERDASFLPVEAERAYAVMVDAVTSRSGYVLATGKYFTNQTATLKAVPDYSNGKWFDGWYDAQGNCLSKDLSYSFTVTGPTTVYAMFSDDLYYDLRTQWYVDNAMRASEIGLTTGNGAFKFDGDSKLTRAMAVVMLSKIDGTDLTGYVSNQFTDVEVGKWYANAIAWAYDKNLISGRSEDTFDPNGEISREEFMAIMDSYLESKEKEITTAEIHFADAGEISSWAYEPVQKALGAGLTSGYPDNTFRPHGSVTRAEGVTVLLKLNDLLQAA